MNPLFDSLKRLYMRGLLTKAQVAEAVIKDPPWITPEEYEQITGEVYAG